MEGFIVWDEEVEEVEGRRFGTLGGKH